MSHLKVLDEPRVRYFTFRCTLCEHTSEWRDGYPKSADEVRIAWTDADGTGHVRTMYEKDHCLICKECMDQIDDRGWIETVDAKGAITLAKLVMYPVNS